LPIPEGAGPDFSYQDLTGGDNRRLLSQLDLAKIAYDPIVAELNETTIKDTSKIPLCKGIL
jgi:hypothetical protein